LPPLDTFLTDTFTVLILPLLPAILTANFLPLLRAAGAALPERAAGAAGAALPEAAAVIFSIIRTHFYIL
jgi:hypothetical protein